MASPSLDSNRVSLADCRGSGAYLLRSQATGAFVPMPCQRNRCGTCGPAKAVATAIAAGLAEPDQMVTLTQVGEDSKRIRARLSDWRYRLRELGYEGDYWGAVERNPRGTGHHVHLWRRGGYVPQRTISEVAQRCGMGRITWIERWRGEAKDIVYGVKGARSGSSYGVKTAIGEYGLVPFLDLHGGRYGIWSRGYFGKPYREAVKEALTLPDREGHDPGPWSVVNVATMYQKRFEEARRSLTSVTEGD